MGTLTLESQSPPLAPSALQVVVYAKSNGLLYWMDDAGVEHGVTDIALMPLPFSLAPNPFFQIDQRVNNATSRANDVYATDRWYVLTQTAAITVTGQVDQENGQPSNVRLSQSQAAAQRFGYASIIEGKFCKHLRGQVVTFRPRVRISASQSIRIAVLEWTGTEDAVTSDVVNSWTNGTFTAGQFFKATTQNVVGVGSKTPAADTWTDMDALTVTLGTTFTNLILMVWVDTVAAQNVTLDIGKVRFVPGTYTGEIALPNLTDELTRCCRYLHVFGGKSTVDCVAMGVLTSSTTANFVVNYRTEMRATPTLEISAVGDWAIRSSSQQVLTVLTLSAISTPLIAGLDSTSITPGSPGFAAQLFANSTANARIRLIAEL